MRKVLIAEDEVIVGHYLQKLLEQHGFSVPGFVSTGEQLLHKFYEEGADLILADIHLAGKLSGVDAVKTLRSLRPALPVLFVSADHTASPVIEPPVRLLAKPFSDPQLVGAVRDLLGLL
jgi:CheY-like chemotaxis protein